MTRAAVIDIGTNSVKLTVADLSDTVSLIKERSTITRLGKDVDSEGRLQEAAIQRTLSVILDFVDDARSNGASSIALAGTSALRDAANGSEVLSKVKSESGLDIEIITGDREAQLAYAAVVSDTAMLPNPNAAVAVFDIGGGSTELVVGVSGKPTDHVSLNIGAVRLTERHFHSDPPTPEEFNAASNDGAEEVRSFFDGKSKVTTVCGVGGTASTLAAIVHQTKDVHGKEVSLEHLEECLRNLRSMTLAERKKLQFLEPERADIIIAGGAILIGLLNCLQVSSFRVSLRGMRYGLLMEQSQRGC